MNLWAYFKVCKHTLSCMVVSAHDCRAAKRVSDWESIAISDREAGLNRLKMDSRHWCHCRWHYHLEVRLWSWTVNLQRFYLEWPARTTPCAFDCSTLLKSAICIYDSWWSCKTCGIVNFHHHMDLELDILTYTNIVTCIRSLHHVKYNRIKSIVLQIWLQVG